MLKKTYWFLRKLSWFYFIPAVVLLVYMPCVTLYFYHKIEFDIAISLMREHCHLIIPLISCIWITFILTEFIDVDGNELVYLYCSTKKLLGILAIVFAWFSLHAIASLIFSNIFFNMGYVIMLQVLIESFAIVSASYLLSFLLSSTAFSMMIIVAYCIFMNVFEMSSRFGAISIFSTPSDGLSVNIIHLIITMLISIGFTSGAYLVSTKKTLFR